MATYGPSASTSARAPSGWQAPALQASDAHCELTVQAVPVPPVKHTGEHAPPAQEWPGRQTVPHAPQLASSVWRLAQ